MYITGVCACMCVHNHTLQVVIVGVLRHASVQECPRQVINSILFVLNSLSNNFSTKVIVYEMIQVRLQELQVVIP